MQLLCSSGVSLESYSWDGRPKEEVVHKDDEVISTNVNIEMTLKTQELACARLTTKPEMIWREVRACACGMAYCSRRYVSCEEGSQGFGIGDTIGTVENTPEYNTMKNSSTRP